MIGDNGHVKLCIYKIFTHIFYHNLYVQISQELLHILLRLQKKRCFQLNTSDGNIIKQCALWLIKCGTKKYDITQSPHVFDNKKRSDPFWLYQKDSNLKWMHNEEEFKNAQKAIAAIWQLEKTRNTKLRWELKNTINIATKHDPDSFRKRIAYCIDAPKTTQWIGEMLSVKHYNILLLH